MGQQDSKQNKDKYNTFQLQFKNNQSKIKFIQKEQSPVFGLISVYRMTEKPYQYIMKYSHKSTSLTQLQELKKFYLSFSSHPNVVNIQQIWIQNKKQMCSNFNELQLYCCYYNFTLKDAIQRKKKRYGFKFAQNDIIYVLKSLLDAGRFYHNNKKQNLKLFSIENIYLTPQGYVKIYLIKTMQASKFINNQNKFFIHEKLISSGRFDTINKLQQFQKFQQTTASLTATARSNKGKKFKNLMGNSSQKIDPFQDLFDIGIAILCLIHLKQKKCYLSSIGLPKLDAIKSDIIENWPQKYYSSFLKQILQSIFMLNVCKINENDSFDSYKQNSSWSFFMQKIAQKEKQNSFVASFYLNMDDDDGQNIQNIKEEHSHLYPKQKRKQILNTLHIHKKLKVNKIITLSNNKHDQN